MSNVLTPNPKQQFFDNNGRPAVGYKLFTYAAGTTTKVDTYLAESGSLNTNPIVLDYRGECDLWIPPNVQYKYVLTRPDDTDPPTSPIWTVDDVSSAQLITLYGGVDTGSANSYVLNFTANFTSYTDGIIIYWIPSNTNFTTSTLNVNGLGAAPIENSEGDPLSGGEIIANQITQVMYVSGGWRLLSTAPITGTYSVNLSGVTPVASGTARYLVANRVVYLTLPALSGTSNATGCTISIPIFLSPAVDQRVPVPAGEFSDNSASTSQVSALIGPSSTIITLLMAGNASGFTPSGTKGFGNAGVCISWPLE